MRTLLNVCMLLSLVLMTKMSYAECKEFKTIDHGSSTEVICVGEPLTATQIKEQDKTVKSKEQSNNKQQLEKDRNYKEQLIEQERKDIERCSLNNTICLSSTPLTDRGKCVEQQASCEKLVILNSPSQNSKTCKRICSLDNAICLSSASITDRGRCSEQQANCDKLCL